MRTVAGRMAKELPRYPLARILLLLSVASQLALASLGSKIEAESRSKEEARSGKIANPNSRDTYLSALEHSHAIKDQPSREYLRGPIYQAISTTTEANRKISVSSSYATVNFGREGDERVVGHTKKYDSYASYGHDDGGLQQEAAVSYGPFTHSSQGRPGGGAYGPASYGPPEKEIALPEPPSLGPFVHVSSPGHAPNGLYPGYGPPDKEEPSPAPYGPLARPHGHKPHYVPYGSTQPGEGRGLGSLQATYSTSYPLPDLLPLPALLPAVDLNWPISLKINAYTLIKIALKLVIFKIVVKFIGLVCLLLFLPKLIDKKDEHNDDDEARRFGEKDKLPMEQLRLLASTVRSSVEHYEKNNKNELKKEKPCQNFGCQVKRLFISDDTWNDYVGLFKSYLVEEERGLNDE